MTFAHVLWLLAVLLALVGVWPFGPYQLTLLAARAFFGPRPIRTSSEAGAQESFALCVCAHNEENVIERKIRNLLDIREAANEDVEILIYCDGCTDGTEAIARRFEPVVKVIVSRERHGKYYGMNMLAEASRASILVFTDADIIVDRELVPALRRCFADPEVGCVDVPLRHTNPDASPTAEVGSAYFRLEGWTKRLESDTGSVIGATGGCYAMRRRLYPTLPPGVSDDFHVAMTVLVQGFRVVRASGVHSYELHPSLSTEEFRRRIRLATQGLNSHRLLWPSLRRLDAWHLYKYFSHRLVRWMSGWFLLAAATVGTLAASLSFGPLPVLLLIGGTAASFAAALALRIRLAERIGSAIVAIAGTSVGFLRGLRGEQVAMWEGPRSSRQGLVLPP